VVATTGLAVVVGVIVVVVVTVMPAGTTAVAAEVATAEPPAVQRGDENPDRVADVGVRDRAAPQRLISPNTSEPPLWTTSLDS
jgi:hypothetical protein